MAQKTNRALFVVAALSLTGVTLPMAGCAPHTIYYRDGSVTCGFTDITCNKNKIEEANRGFVGDLLARRNPPIASGYINGHATHCYEGSDTPSVPGVALSATTMYSCKKLLATRQLFLTRYGQQIYGPSLPTYGIQPGGRPPNGSTIIVVPQF